MKAKVIKKNNKQLLDTIKSILETESARVESCINLCAKCIETTISQIYPGTLTEELKDTFYAFMTHGVSVVLIKNQQKKEDNT